MGRDRVSCTNLWGNPCPQNVCSSHQFSDNQIPSIIITPSFQHHFCAVFCHLLDNLTNQHSWNFVVTSAGTVRLRRYKYPCLHRSGSSLLKFSTSFMMPRGPRSFSSGMACSVPSQPSADESLRDTLDNVLHNWFLHSNSTVQKIVFVVFCPLLNSVMTFRLSSSSFKMPLPLFTLSHSLSNLTSSCLGLLLVVVSWPRAPRRRPPS